MDWGIVEIHSSLHMMWRVYIYIYISIPLVLNTQMQKNILHEVALRIMAKPIISKPGVYKAIILKCMRKDDIHWLNVHTAITLV